MTNLLVSDLYEASEDASAAQSFSQGRDGDLGLRIRCSIGVGITSSTVFRVPEYTIIHKYTPKPFWRL